MLHKKVIALFCMLLGTTYSSVAQCAMCKAVLENGDQTMAESINSGISYLMVFPYILVATLLYFIYRHKKQQA